MSVEEEQQTLVVVKVMKMIDNMLVDTVVHIVEHNQLDMMVVVVEVVLVEPSSLIVAYNMLEYMKVHKLMDIVLNIVQAFVTVVFVECNILDHTMVHNYQDKNPHISLVSSVEQFSIALVVLKNNILVCIEVNKMLVNKNLDMLVVVVHSSDNKMVDTLVRIDWHIQDYIV